jgi:hypothetical protein
MLSRLIGLITPTLNDGVLYPYPVIHDITYAVTLQDYQEMIYMSPLRL